MKKVLMTVGCAILILGVSFGGGMLVGNYKFKNSQTVVQGGSEKETDLEISQEIVNQISEDKDVDVEDTSMENLNTTLTKDTSVRIEENNTPNEPEFSTPWKTNTDGTLSIAIEGRGPDGIEEGEGVVYVKKDSGMTSLQFLGSLESQAPIYVEWVDNESFLTTMVNKYGRVFTEGKLYLINTNSLEASLVYNASSDEEIIEANKISDDTINIKLRKYNDDGSTVAIEKNITIK